MQVDVVIRALAWESVPRTPLEWDHNNLYSQIDRADVTVTHSNAEP